MTEAESEQEARWLHHALAKHDREHRRAVLLLWAVGLPVLVLVIIGLNLAAIIIRNNLREKYRALEG